MYVSVHLFEYWLSYGFLEWKESTPAPQKSCFFYHFHRTSKLVESFSECSFNLTRLSWPLISSSSNAGRRAVSPAISKAWFTVGSCDKWIIDRPHSFQNVPSVILALFSCDNNVWLSLLSLHWKPSLNFSDYFESLLVPQLLRGENDSKQSDEFRATGSRHLLKTVNDHVTVIFTSRARLHRSSPQDH